MHTGQPSFKHRAAKQPLHVDLYACTLLLGWVVDQVLAIVEGIPDETVDARAKFALARAFSKVMWIQQDLFQRHYTRTDEEAAAFLEKVRAEDGV